MVTLLFGKVLISVVYYSTSEEWYWNGGLTVRLIRTQKHCICVYIYLCLSDHQLKPFRVLSIGVAGAVDWKCWSDTGRERPVFYAATDPYWPNPELHHPADIPLHLWKQEDGHHSASEGQSILVVIVINKYSLETVIFLTCFKDNYILACQK